MPTKAISWCGYTVHILLGPGSWSSHVTQTCTTLGSLRWLKCHILTSLWNLVRVAVIQVHTH